MSGHRGQPGHPGCPRHPGQPWRREPPPITLVSTMPSPRKRKPKSAVTVKLDPAFAAELRNWVQRERGRPLFIESLSAFAEQAFRREMERLNLVVSGALPLDRAAGATGGTDDETPPRQDRPVNAHTR